MGTPWGRAGKPHPDTFDPDTFDADRFDTDDGALDEARLGLWRARKRLSATHVATFGQIIAGAAGVAGDVWLARENLPLFWLVLLARPSGSSCAP